VGVGFGDDSAAESGYIWRDSEDVIMRKLTLQEAILEV
jgi:hypothetical protein